MITRKQRNKIMSIVNMCNAIKPNDKEDVEFWVLKIKELSEEVLK